MQTNFTLLYFTKYVRTLQIKQKNLILYRPIPMYCPAETSKNTYSEYFTCKDLLPSAV